MKIEIKKICPNCGISFLRKSSRQKYCSFDCKEGKSEKICNVCNKEFITSRHSTGKYCSLECWYKDPNANRKESKNIINSICSSCNKEFESFAYQDRKYCSKGCAKKDLRQVKHYNWKGGKYKLKGYTRLTLPDGRKIWEHRFIMEQKIGRKLLPQESVHHKNGIRDDNNIENLELWVKTHLAGQRVEDMIKFIVDTYKDKVVKYIQKGTF